jgi:hypothetical protein
VSALSFLPPKEKVASKVLLSTPFSLFYAPLITINFVTIGKGVVGPTLFSSSFHAFVWHALPLFPLLENDNFQLVYQGFVSGHPSTP